MTTHRIRTSAVTLVLVAASVAVACGEDTVPPSNPSKRESDEALRRTVVGEPICAACDIILTELVLLGAPTDPSSVREDAGARGCMVGRLETGDYVMSGAVGGGQIFVYDEAGPLRRVLGRRGEGPGEFGTMLRVAVGPGDTLHVMDEVASRMQVLTAAGDFVRSFAAPAQYRSFALLQDGGVLFHRLPLEPHDPLFYLVDRSGQERLAFGSPTMDRLELEAWIVSPAFPAGFWTADSWRYELYRWDSPGSLVEILVREAAWFPPFAGDLPASLREMYETRPPLPFLAHVWQDPDGLIWTYSLVPAEGWQPGVPLRPEHHWRNRIFDMTVEVLDPDQALPVASRRFDVPLGQVCGSHLMYAVVDSDEGDTRVQVVEPALSGYRDP